MWPNGPDCPHCGGVERISKMQGKSTRIGLYKCYQCRKPFTVRMGTIFESSKLPLHVWLQAMYLIAGSKKGISSNQLHRTLGVTLKTAWFLSHRIREAMREATLLRSAANGGAVEVDETYIGRKVGTPIRRRLGSQNGGARPSRSRHRPRRLFHVERRRQYPADRPREPLPRSTAHDRRDTMYRRIGREFAEHRAVHHYNKEYVRGDVTTNTIEGAFSIFKRGMRGVYQHCAEKHLHRYLAEFEFRYSHREATGCNDADRADKCFVVSSASA